MESLRTPRRLIDKLRGTLPALVKIFKKNGNKPLKAKELVKAAKKYKVKLPTTSKEPNTVISRDLSLHVKSKKGKSFFVRVKPGLYQLRNY